MKPQLNKESFIKIINIIEKQYEKTRKFCESLDQILDGHFVYDLDSDLIMGIIKFLEEVTNDKNEWIQYYIFELDFGERYKDGSITQNEKIIPLKTKEDLWNILNVV